MDSKNKSKVDESTEIYEVTKKEVISEELHPVLVQMIEKSKENHRLGNVFSHDEAMRIYNDKIASRR